jgi:hypothetical protein
LSDFASLFAGSGTVSSVGLTAPSIFAVAGSPVTLSGQIAITLNTQAANRIFAGPTTGAAAAPTFRALVAADLPALPTYTFSTVYSAAGTALPAAGTAGRIAAVSDATAPAIGVAYSSGGAVFCLVLDTGTGWVTV